MALRSVLWKTITISLLNELCLQFIIRNLTRFWRFVVLIHSSELMVTLTEQFEINKAKIRAELSSMRPSLDMLPSRSALAMLHNFGSLNRAGGERRLNVAVTRAKCNVQLVSSMHCTIRTLT